MRTVVVSLLVALGASVGDAYRVLVVGSSGKLGKHVVHQLRAQGIAHRVLVRTPPSVPAASPLTEVAVGSLADQASLDAALEGCDACIAVSGATRFTRVRDVLTGRLFRTHPPPDEPEHPACVNYEGIRNLARAAGESAACTKLVRVTGLTLGLSAFSPVSLLFNTLLSLSGRWHALGEAAIRDAGVDYSIVRPGGLMGGEPGEPGPLREGRARLLGPRLAPPGRISREDVASLCVQCLTHPGASNATFSCAWSKQKPAGGNKQKRAAAGAAAVEEATGAWSLLLAGTRPDARGAWPAPRHRLAVASLLAAALAACLTVVAKAASALLGVALTTAMRFLPAIPLGLFIASRTIGD